jgi:hypothetical protein
MKSTKGKMNMHFETIANNQSCNAVLRAKIARHAGTRRIWSKKALAAIT